MELLLDQILLAVLGLLEAKQEESFSSSGTKTKISSGTYSKLQCQRCGTRRFPARPGDDSGPGSLPRTLSLTAVIDGPIR